MPDTTPTPEALQASSRSHRSWAVTHDRTARTGPARRAFEQRFEDEVDPNRLLEPEERALRAGHARQAYFLALAAKSATARSRRERRRVEDADLARELRAAADALAGDVA